LDDIFAMWQHNYTPVAGSLLWSALVAAFPIFVLLFLLGILRKPAWISALWGLAAAVVVAIFEYGMPLRNLVGAITYGAAYGLFPIGWIVFSSILLYRVTLETGKFEIIKDSVGHLTEDRRMQTLLIAFAFGAFIEGAAGFGTPIAVAAAMLAGLGFAPFYAAALCLLANTAPVAFGSIGIPIITLAGVTGLPLERLSAGVGRVCAPISLIIPAYLIMVMGGWKALKGVLPGVAVCGILFASVQFLISNFVSVQLTDLLASLAAMSGLVILLRFWRPRDSFTLGGEHVGEHHEAVPHYPVRKLLVAWMPYMLLVVFVLLWGVKAIQPYLNRVTVVVNWPWLHNEIQRMPPVTVRPSLYPAAFNLNWLSAAGTACTLAAILGAFLLGVTPRKLAKIFANTGRQLARAELTMAAVLAIAFLMNYAGATGTLGLAFAATGKTFPFFSALLGWLGVFLTGSDTSANALFGPLQVVTANKLSMNPVLMAASNSAGGVMGKMISLASIAVASAATHMKREDEARLFRFTIRHSVLLASMIGLIVMFYAYVMPQFAP
jgi:lactate permease